MYLYLIWHNFVLYSSSKALRHIRYSLGPDPLETVPLRVNRDISFSVSLVPEELSSFALSCFVTITCFSELKLIYVTWHGHKGAVTFPACLLSKLVSSSRSLYLSEWDHQLQQLAGRSIAARCLRRCVHNSSLLLAIGHQTKDRVSRKIIRALLKFVIIIFDS